MTGPSVKTLRWLFSLARAQVKRIRLDTLKAQYFVDEADCEALKIQRHGIKFSRYSPGILRPGGSFHQADLELSDTRRPILSKRYNI
jgi:hypothetical protein